MLQKVPRTIDFHAHVHSSSRSGMALQRRYISGKSERTGALSEMLKYMPKIGVAKSLIVPWIPAQDVSEEMMLEWKDDANLTEEKS